MQSNKGQPHGMRIIGETQDPDTSAATGATEPLTSPASTALASASDVPRDTERQETGADSLSDEAHDVPDEPEAQHAEDVLGHDAQQLNTPTLGDVLLAVEELWPASLAEPWDEVGPVVGRPERPVTRIMFAVDPTLEVIADAISRGTQLLITHHPLLLKPVNSVAATSFKGEAVHLLIESGCALVTAHTNADSALGGVSDVIADALGVLDTIPLSPSKDGLPEEGIGRVGMLAEPMKLGDFAQRVFETMPTVAGGVRVAGDPAGIVQRIAVCGGAGDSLFDAVRASEADAYVTADLRHHPASEAREASLNGKPYLIDVSHFASEWLWLPAAAKALGNVLEEMGHDVEIEVSQINSDPWDFILTP